MHVFTDLWIAILASAAAAWFWAFLSWAAIGLHRGDFVRLPDEPGFSESLRKMGMPPGLYKFPYATKGEERTKEFMDRWHAGPVGIFHLWNPEINMSKCMLLSFLTYVIVSFLMAYVGHEVLPAGAGFLRVFQIMGTMGAIAYCFAFIPNMIWFQSPLRVIVLSVIDGLIQGFATGAIFAAMWPGK